MYRFLLVAILSFPIAIYAQPDIELGLTAGGVGVTSLKGINTNPYIYGTIHKKIPVDFDKAFGFNGAAKALLNFHSFQLGLGVEGGMIKGTVAREVGFKKEIEENIMYSFYVIPGVETEQQKIAAPYLMPHLFFHIKFNFSDGVYLYTGPIGGRLFSKNDLSWNSKSSGWVAGGNLGIVVKLTDRVSLDIAEGWRKVWVRGDEINLSSRMEWYNPKVLGPPTSKNQQFTHVAYSLNSYNLSYGSTAIGVRLTL